MPRRKTIKLSTPAELRRGISRITNMLLNGEIDPKTANAILYGCNSALGSIRVDELEKKVSELEGLLSTMEGR